MKTGGQFRKKVFDMDLRFQLGFRIPWAFPPYAVCILTVHVHNTTIACMCECIKHTEYVRAYTVTRMCTYIAVTVVQRW